MEKFFKLGLIKLPEYDDKDYLYLPNDADESEEHLLSPDERMALVQCNLAKTELVYVRRQESPNGSVQYDLAKDNKNKMHDDRAYTMAMGAFALSKLRRGLVIL